MADPEEIHIFSEISRLSQEIHRFRFGADAKLNKAKLKNYEHEIRLRIEKGEPVPGFRFFVPPPK